MNDRVLQWAGAGVLAAGLSTGMLFGTAVAASAPDTGAASDPAKSSQSTDGTDGTQDTKPPESGGVTSYPKQGAADDQDGADGQDSQDVTDGEETAGDGQAGEQAKDGRDSGRRRGNDGTSRRQQIRMDDDRAAASLTADNDDIDAAVDKDVDLGVSNEAPTQQDPEPETGVVAVTSAATIDAPPREAKLSEPSEPKVVDTIVGTVSSVVGTLLSPFAASPTTPQMPAAEPQMWTLAAASRREFENAFESPSLVEDVAPNIALTEMQAPQAISAAATQPSLINIVGSFFFNVFQAFEQAVAGAPQVPPGSTVHVQRSQLNIDCGPGYTVDADWYFPDTEEPPTRLIYFQHGFPGSSAEYDYAAAELAERNQAIVVAPTISSNLFDCYACQLGGDPMHAAVAKLFLGDRADLLASAKAAGFEGDALPERFVIAGHSGGGQLAGGAAGYFEEFAKDDEDHNLVGVLLLDTSPIGGAIERGVGKIPDDIPVYTIGGAPGFLNSQGGVELVLEKLRPNEFVGVELVNGTHGDAFQSHNLIVQIGGWIAGLGIPRPENIEAVQTLTQGWIDDWYDGTDTGVYGALGSTVDIPDTDGARAYVLPAPAHQWTIVDLIVEFGLQSVTFVNVFATCAEDPSAAAASTPCSAVPASVLSTSLSRELEN